MFSHPNQFHKNIYVLWKKFICVIGIHCKLILIFRKNNVYADYQNEQFNSFLIYIHSSPCLNIGILLDTFDKSSSEMALERAYIRAQLSSGLQRRSRCFSFLTPSPGSVRSWKIAVCNCAVSLQERRETFSTPRMAAVITSGETEDKSSAPKSRSTSPCSVWSSWTNMASSWSDLSLQKEKFADLSWETNTARLEELIIGRIGRV